MNKIIFLDFDGVIINQKSWSKASGMRANPDEDCIRALNHITDSTGARIVVSSTWRRLKIPGELRVMLQGWGVTGQFIGVTPSGMALTERGQEIAEWLKYKQHKVESFVIIDDDNDMGDLLPKLIQTHFSVGLTMEDAKEAIARLNQ